MLPTVLSEQLVQCFNFYQDGVIRQGMRHLDELYGLLCEVEVENRLQGYEIACQLMEQAVPVVITACSQHYRIWVNLRSLAYQHWLLFNTLPLKIQPPVMSLLHPTPLPNPKPDFDQRSSQQTGRFPKPHTKPSRRSAAVFKPNEPLDSPLAPPNHLLACHQ